MAVMFMRGIPGSGKSTYARKSVEDASALGFTTALLSTDDQFVDPLTGEYKFDSAMLGWAHSRNFKRFLDELAFGFQTQTRTLIVVDNTNIRCWEVSPYVLAAQAFGHSVKIVRVVCDVEVAAARNTHGVPADIVRRMHDQMEPSLPFWDEQIVDTRE